MTIRNLIRKWKDRNKKELTYEERKAILLNSMTDDLLRALRLKHNIPENGDDYILFQADGKHLARFYEGSIQMGCNKRSPQEWIDIAESQAKNNGYNDTQKQKYILFFEMCLKIQQIEKENL